MPETTQSDPKVRRTQQVLLWLALVIAVGLSLKVWFDKPDEVAPATEVVAQTTEPVASPVPDSGFVVQGTPLPPLDRSTPAPKAAPSVKTAPRVVAQSAVRPVAPPATKEPEVPFKPHPAYQRPKDPDYDELESTLFDQGEDK